MVDVRSPSDVLRSAAALVRSGWCAGAFAKNAGGGHVHPMSAYAVAWDVFGAVCRAAAGDGNLAEDALRRVDSICGEEPKGCAGLASMSYNDRNGRTSEEVAYLLERAAIAEGLR